MTNLFLFGSFGFSEVLARALDLGASMMVFNDSPTIEEADDLALNAEWQAVGNDILNARQSSANLRNP